MAKVTKLIPCSFWCLFLWILASTCAFAEVSQSADNLSKMPGWKIIQDGRLGNCITCHTIQFSANSSKEKQGNFGPPLTKVGAKYSPEKLRQWVTDARQMNPETLMPPYGSQVDINNPNIPRVLLTQEQIIEVVDFLVLLK